MKLLQAKRPLAQKVPVERLHMPQVEDDSMAFGDRSFVKCLVAQNLKKLVGRLPGLHQPEGCTKISAQGGWLR